jgi:hypothetical protein
VSRKTKPRREKPSGAEGNFIGPARRAGFFVLFEGTPDDRVWRFYKMPVGKCIGYWSPRTTQYTFFGRSGTATDPREVLKAARAAAA